MIAPTPTDNVPLERGGFSSALSNTPTELLVVIFRFLDNRSLLRCCSVCRYFNRVIEDSSELQYSIELSLDGMMDSSSSTLPVYEKLQLLRSRRRTWSDLEWSQHLVLPMPGPCQAYELVGGLFAKTMCAGTVENGSRHLTTCWLPSVIGSSRTTTRRDIGLSSRDFAMDPSQDLIAFLQADDDEINIPLPGLLKVHLRTISTNQQHPEAASPALQGVIVSPISDAFIQIVDEIIGMMFSAAEGPCVTLWDWKNGRLLIDIQLPHVMSDFSFISPRAYMLTSSYGSGSIEIFSFNVDHSATSVAPVHVASLSLPPILPGVQILDIHTHSGPFIARCPPGKPFAAANEARLHVVSVQYGRTGIGGLIYRPRYCLFFHHKTLVRYINQYKENVAGSYIAVPWDDWGPLKTQFMYQRGPFQWLRYVHGNRVAVPVIADGRDHPVQILDFNVTGSARQQGAGGTQSSDNSCITPANIFAAPVITSLPYRSVGRVELDSYSGIMIDDERLIGLKYPAFSNGDTREIHVFTF